MLGIPRIIAGTDLTRNAGAGDLVPNNLVSGSLTTAGDGTITAALIANGIVRRTGPGGAYADTTDTAENIRIALGTPPNGSSFFFLHCNDVAQAMTFTAGVGITTAGTVNSAASVKRWYLVTMVNNTPLQTLLVNQTNASKVITGLTAAQTALLTVGMAVSGTSIAASSVIDSIQPGVGVTLNNNATATLSNNSVTFSPVVKFEGLGVMTA